MLDHSILQSQIAQIENEIVQAEARKVSAEMLVEDAAVETGNAGADHALKEQAVAARNTIVMLDRQLKTRHARLGQLTTKRDKLVADAAQAQPRTIDMPAEVAPPSPVPPPVRQMVHEPESNV